MKCRIRATPRIDWTTEGFGRVIHPELYYVDHELREDGSKELKFTTFREKATVFPCQITALWMLTQEIFEHTKFSLEEMLAIYEFEPV